MVELVEYASNIIAIKAKICEVSAVHL